MKELSCVHALGNIEGDQNSKLWNHGFVDYVGYTEQQFTALFKSQAYVDKMENDQDDDAPDNLDD